MKWQLVAITILILASGCHPAPMRAWSKSELSLTAQPSTEEIPESFEIPIDDTATPADAAEVAPVIEETPAPVVTSSVNDLIKNAERVMKLEGKKIGTACNKFIARVLEVSGFVKQGFLANDFDVYAKKYINHFKSAVFEKDASPQTEERLRDYVWSFPERTAFILQWSRSGTYGHIALMERIGDKLVIYQASLHQHTARKDQTTIKTLLTGYNRRTLTVYTDLTP